MNQITFEMKGKCLYINTVVQHFNEKVMTPGLLECPEEGHEEVGVTLVFQINFRFEGRQQNKSHISHCCSCRAAPSGLAIFLEGLGVPLYRFAWYCILWQTEQNLIWQEAKSMKCFGNPRWLKKPIIAHPEGVFFLGMLQHKFDTFCIPGPSKGCQLNPKKWRIDTF